jgi:DeoR/GlpR family transcriptional regulator of sugar metabolism
MSKAERKEKIRQFIYEAGRATVAELCARFGVSEATTRRDLEELDAEGTVRRVHGGPMP